MEYTGILAHLASLVASAVVALIAWGLRGEIKAIRLELKAGLAEAEVRFFQRVNGSYVRKELHVDMTARVDRIENRVEALE